MLVFSAHMVLNQKNGSVIEQDNLIEKINSYLSEKYKIIESTIQTTSKSEAEVCNLDGFGS